MSKPTNSSSSNSSAAPAVSSGCCCCSFRCLSLAVLVIAIVIGFSLFIDQPQNWVFDNKKLQVIAQRGIAAAHKNAKNGVNNATATEVIAAVIKEVKAEYPSYINDKRGWILNNAGGAMGAMTVLHASFSEYVIIFGTPLGTEGHTGRFFAEDFFTIIHGEQWASPADVFEKQVFRAGDQHYLPRHTAKQYKMPDSCFALEYARGNIPSMMGFGLFDTFFSTLDWHTLYQTVEVSAVDMIGYALKGKF